MLRKNLILSTLCLALTSATIAQKKYDFYDGPYITELGDSLEVLWVEGGEAKSQIVLNDSSFNFSVKGLPQLRANDLQIIPDTFKRFENVEKFVAISDIHGQHSIFVKLLKLHGIIDSTEEWVFGNGHLVIVGDVLDRGAQVTESLWLIKKLERQAMEYGGKVHLLLGNHELMVMHGDVAYINPKYRYTSGAFSKEYPRFFSDSTVLGQWLRSKNVAAVINKTGFVHGGFSQRVLDKESSLEKINSIFKKVILPKPNLTNERNSLTHLLYFNNGPLWYRGYADPNGFDIVSAETILSILDIESIVVGHTSMPKIVSIHNSKILLVDSSIKFGKSGELLMYEGDSLYRCLFDGQRIAIGSKANPDAARSPFQYVYDLEDTDLTIILDTDLGLLFGKNRHKKEYQEASLVAIHNDEFNREWKVKIRTRGNMRKKVCRLPPIKIDFPKSTLDYLGFTNNDKLKLVLPCKSSGSAQQALYREHIIYQMYQVIDTLGYRTHLVNVKLEDEGKEKYDLVGFFIEDEQEYADRTGSIIIEKGILRDEAIQRASYLKMMFFQYMILNVDFYISNKHNLEIIKMPEEKRPRAIPYDFDYSGIIDQNYAVPHSSLPIDDVREPYFMGKNVKKGEVSAMKVLFENKRGEIEAVIQNADYLSKSSKSYMLKDVQRFYSVLNNERMWKSEFRLK